MKSESGEGENMNWHVEPGVNLKFYQNFLETRIKKKHTTAGYQKGEQIQFLQERLSVAILGLMPLVNT